MQISWRLMSILIQADFKISGECILTMYPIMTDGNTSQLLLVDVHPPRSPSMISICFWPLLFPNSGPLQTRNSLRFVLQAHSRLIPYILVVLHLIHLILRASNHNRCLVAPLVHSTSTLCLPHLLNLHIFVGPPVHLTLRLWLT